MAVYRQKAKKSKVASTRPRFCAYKSCGGLLCESMDKSGAREIADRLKLSDQAIANISSHLK